MYNSDAFADDTISISASFTGYRPETMFETISVYTLSSSIKPSYSFVPFLNAFRLIFCSSKNGN